MRFPKKNLSWPAPETRRGFAKSQYRPARSSQPSNGRSPPPTPNPEPGLANVQNARSGMRQRDNEQPRRGRKSALNPPSGPPPTRIRAPSDSDGPGAGLKETCGRSFAWPLRLRSAGFEETRGFHARPTQHQKARRPLGIVRVDLFDFGIDVAGDVEEVRPAVVVEIHQAGSPLQLAGDGTQTGFRGFVGVIALAVV